jgi:hypothetical protein
MTAEQAIRVRIVHEAANDLLARLQEEMSVMREVPNSERLLSRCQQAEAILKKALTDERLSAKVNLLVLGSAIVAITPTYDVEFQLRLSALSHTLPTSRVPESLSESIEPSSTVEVEGIIEEVGSLSIGVVDEKIKLGILLQECALRFTELKFRGFVEHIGEIGFLMQERHRQYVKETERLNEEM